MLTVLLWYCLHCAQCVIMRYGTDGEGMEGDLQWIGMEGDLQYKCNQTRQ